MIMMRGAIYGLTAAAIWGGMYVVSDVVLPTIPPFTLLTIRLLLGIVTLTAVVWRAGAIFPARRDLLRVLGVGMVGFGVSIGAQFVGTDKSNALNGTLVTSASPAFILVFAALILRERLTIHRIAAVALATIGVVVIVEPSKPDFSSQTFVGNAILALAAVTWGLYSVLVRLVSARIDTLMVTLLAFLGGLIVTVPAALLELPRRPIGDISLWIILGILYLGVVSTAAAMWLWNRAFALVDASVASLFFFAQPLVGALLSALLGQAMTPTLWVGSILIILGVLLSLYPLEKVATRLIATRSEIAD
jgi:drug/metabolite transporter (DMT)-like permease